MDDLSAIIDKAVQEYGPDLVHGVYLRTGDVSQWKLSFYLSLPEPNYASLTLNLGLNKGHTLANPDIFNQMSNFLIHTDVGEVHNSHMHVKSGIPGMEIDHNNAPQFLLQHYVITFVNPGMQTQLANGIKEVRLAPAFHAFAQGAYGLQFDADSNLVARTPTPGFPPFLSAQKDLSAGIMVSGSKSGAEIKGYVLQKAGPPHSATFAELFRHMPDEIDSLHGNLYARGNLVNLHFDLYVDPTSNPEQVDPKFMAGMTLQYHSNPLQDVHAKINSLWEMFSSLTGMPVKMAAENLKIDRKPQ